DMNGDGWLDAISAPSRTAKLVSVFLNKGAAPTAFLDPCRVAPPAAVGSLAIGDFGAGTARDLVLSHPDVGVVELVYSPLEQCGLDSGCFGGEPDACFETGPRFKVAGPQRLAPVTAIGRDAA